MKSAMVCVCVCACVCGWGGAARAGVPGPGDGVGCCARAGARTMTPGPGGRAPRCVRARVRGVGRGGSGPMAGRWGTRACACVCMGGVCGGRGRDQGVSEGLPRMHKHFGEVSEAMSDKQQ